MSLKNRLTNYAKEYKENFNYKTALFRFLNVMVVLAIVDAIVNPQDGIGKIAIETVGTIPQIVYMALTGLCIIWFGLSTIEKLEDQIPEIPIAPMIGGIVGTQYYTTQYVLANSILSNTIPSTIANFGFGILLGTAVWFALGTAIAGITMSILGIDPSENTQKRKAKRTDDPYNDKHAAEILDNDS